MMDFYHITKSLGLMIENFEILRYVYSDNWIFLLGYSKLCGNEEYTIKNTVRLGCYKE